jgi:hypothetical protein
MENCALYQKPSKCDKLDNQTPDDYVLAKLNAL